MARYSLAQTGGKNINLGAFSNEKHAALMPKRDGRGDLTRISTSLTRKPLKKKLSLGRATKRIENVVRQYIEASARRGTCTYHALCNINIVRERVGQVSLGHMQVRCINVVLYGVPEHELNFPKEEGSELSNVAIKPRKQHMFMITFVELVE